MLDFRRNAIPRQPPTYHGPAHPRSARRGSRAPGLTLSGGRGPRGAGGGVTVAGSGRTPNIATSNEELFTWVSQTGRKFDVMFPTNYTVETMEKAGLVVNLNKDWIPNYVNIFGRTPTSFPDRFEPYRSDHRYVPDYPDYGGFNNEAEVDFRSPDLNGYQYRMNRDTYPEPRGSDQITWDEQNSLIAVPYQWGTTGIGYRSAIF